jgi:hypothetical protein
VQPRPARSCAGVAPITETDDRSPPRCSRPSWRRCCRRWRTSPATCRCCAADLRPDPLMFNLPFSGFTDEQQAEIRSWQSPRWPVPRRRLRAGSRRRRRPTAADARVHGGGAGMATTCPCSRRSWRTRARTVVRRSGAPTSWPRRPTLQRGHHRCRHVGHPGRAPLAAGGRAVHHPRQERRRRWHLVSRPPTPVAGSTTRTTTTATRSRSGTTGRSTTARRTCCTDYFADCAPTRSTCVGTPSSAAPSRAVGVERREQTWTVHYVDEAGAQRTITASVVISAVGQLNRPKFPTEIDGFGTFAGETMHSAQWRHDLSLAGKRVVCIGTGASALQFLPHVAAQVAAIWWSRSARRRGWRRRPTTTMKCPTASVAVHPRAQLQRVQPLRHLLADGRRRAGGCARRPDLGERRQFGQHDQRVRSPDAGRVLQRRVRRPPGSARRRWCRTTRWAPSEWCATTACGHAR